MGAGWPMNARHCVYEEGAAMTQGELEAELGWVREQVSEIQARQRRQERHWLRSGLAALCVAFLFEVVGVTIAATYGVNPTPAICTILTFAALQSVALGLIFSFAGGPFERLSVQTLLGRN
jgi:hypothetical protein